MAEKKETVPMPREQLEAHLTEFIHSHNVCTIATCSDNIPRATALEYEAEGMVLYILMGVALFLVWRQGLDTQGVKLALTVFAVQLVLNALWSIIFFGMQLPAWAFGEIILLWLAIVATLWAFWRVMPAAGWLLVPYLVWVSFAAVLNGSIWILNR